jgi:hydrogenase nickel incorporation protein HypA/HybF
MHEISVALSLLEIIQEKCREEGCQTVASVRVRVGKASGILPEAFAFAFDAVKPDTVARDAKFIIDVIPLGGLCSGCGNPFTTEEAYLLECPSCSSTLFTVNQGRELELVELEVNE